MGQYKRKDFAHWFDTTPTAGTRNYVVEGVGVEALSLEYNPQIDQFKSILDDVADATFDSYQIQSNVSGKRIYDTDEIWSFLNEARRNVDKIETTMLEIDMKSLNNSSYTASKYNVLIVINNFLGENATISYDLYVKGSPENGTVTFTDGKPTFTGTTSL